MVGGQNLHTNIILWYSNFARQILEGCLGFAESKLLFELPGFCALQPAAANGIQPTRKPKKPSARGMGKTWQNCSQQTNQCRKDGKL